MIFATVLSTLIAQATPAATCATPNVNAKVTHAAPAEYPQAAARRNLGPETVLVQVRVGPTGALEYATIYKSSGDADIDRASLDTARNSTYAPKIVDCVATAATYLFRMQFDPNGTIVGAFHAPAGWRASKTVSYVWTKGDASISLGSYETTDLAGTRTETLAALGSIVPALDEKIHVCDGKVDGWRLQFSRPGEALTTYAVFAVENGFLYSATYRGPNPVPDEVAQSMLNLCPERHADSW